VLSGQLGTAFFSVLEVVPLLRRRGWRWTDDDQPPVEEVAQRPSRDPESTGVS